ncbi:MAG: hypothetical protein PW792_09840 [Acidobacteriaceae bacterium]|nr:hypothetical protein [Acidobacteriaceae bacterium]
MKPASDFEVMLKADQKVERRLFWAELLVIAIVLVALGVRFWLLRG